MTAALFVRKKNRFDPESKNPFKISRSKIELFCECPRCFFIDVKLGITRPPMLPFNLNNAVDQLLKTEFDQFRQKNEQHPLMAIHQIDAKPFSHPSLDEWRENFKGITYLDPKTNFIITGAIDDVWINSKGELMIVDYKATSKDQTISHEDDLYPAYKRQMEIYQWIFKKNGFQVSDEGYFVYCNGLKNKPAFKRHLEFAVNVISYKGQQNWIESRLDEIKALLMQDTLPTHSSNCEYCKFSLLTQQIES